MAFWRTRTPKDQTTSVSPETTPESVPPVNEANDSLESLQGDLRALAAFVERLGEDLRSTQPDLQRSEGAEILQHLSRLQGRLTGILTTLERVVTRTASGAARGSVRLQTISRRTQDVEDSAGAVGAAAEQLYANISEVARASEDAADLSRQIDELVTAGQSQSSETVALTQALQQQMQHMQRQLDHLADGVKAIAPLSALIDDIASRTHLLALNAAIEAARAGQEGRGFAVVAAEVRKLAEGTAQRTREITTLVRQVTAEVEPVRQLLTEGVRQVERTAHRSEAVGEELGRIQQLSGDTRRQMESVAAAIEQQSAAVQSVLASLQDSVTPAITSLKQETGQVAGELMRVAELVEEGYGRLGEIQVESTFHQALAMARSLARQAGELFEAPLAAGKVTLEQMLALQYTEIKGPAIQSLSRLFNINRVPTTGFTPPKYATAYDALVDEPLRRLYDQIMQQRPDFTPLLLDLNTYVPVHNSKLCRDWTGDPAKDLEGNRVKRFLESPVMLRAARTGLGGGVERIGTRVTRREFLTNGCRLTQPAGGDHSFQVLTYASDLGAVGTVVTVPFYIRGERWGCALIYYVSQP